jgi:hypothetical protein
LDLEESLTDRLILREMKMEEEEERILEIDEIPTS